MMYSVARTDVGRMRKINEDNFFTCHSLSEIMRNLKTQYGKYPEVYAVADGMGGHEAGEVASMLATQAIQEFFYGKNPPLLQYWLPQQTDQETDFTHVIEKAILEANRHVYQAALQDEHCQGMGTTLSLVAVLDNLAYIGHVGDSRIYCIRQGGISRLTDDHSLVEEMMRNGDLTEDQAKNHPKKHILTRAVGTSPEVKMDLACHPLQKDDILLLCTDGLTNLVTAEEIKEIVCRGENLDEMAERLINLANYRGGYDNITVLLVEFA